MDAAAELGRNPVVSKHQIQPDYMEMSRLARDGTAEHVSRYQILRRERGQGNINFPFSADHEQDWQPYPVEPYSCYMLYYHTIHTQYILPLVYVRNNNNNDTYTVYTTSGMHVVPVLKSERRSKPCVNINIIVNININIIEHLPNQGGGGCITMFSVNK